MKKLLAYSIMVLAVVMIIGCAPKTKAYLGFAKPNNAKAPPELMAKIVNAGDAFSYPDANTIIIESIDSAIYSEDGSQIQYSYALSKPLTPQGLKDESQTELSYDDQMMKVEIIYAAVIHPDSTIEFVPDSEIIDQVASEGMAEMDIYWTNLRKKVVHLPQLYPGDAVAMAYRYEFLKPYFEGVISGIGGFQTTEPIHTNRMINLIPKSKANEIRYKIVNDSKGWVRFIEYDWEDYHVFCWESDSTPALIAEVGMPPATEFVPLVLFSNVSWKELSKKAWDVTEPPMKITDPEIAKTIEALVETCTTEFDSIRTIGLWVAQEVRYVGLSLGDKEGITPHDVNETFQAQSGVCKDKSALAVAMLRAAGIEAYNVLTNPMSYVIYDIATNQFNHQIILARMRNGEEVFIDVTDDICKDLLPGYYSKRGYLVLTEKGEDLKYFPLFSGDKNKGNIEARSRIDTMGNLHSTVVITGDGLYDEVIRQIGQYLEKEDQKRFFRQLVTQIDPSAKLIEASIEPDPVKQLGIPAQITIKYEIPDYAVTADGTEESYLLLTAPLAQHIFDILAAVLEENTKLDERKYPLWFMYAFGSDMKEILELPEVYQPKSIPKNVEINNPYLKYSMEYNIEGNLVTYECSMSLKDVDIPLKDYTEFRNAITEYKNSEKGLLILNRNVE